MATILRVVFASRSMFSACLTPTSPTATPTSKRLWDNLCWSLQHAICLELGVPPCKGFGASLYIALHLICTVVDRTQTRLGAWDSGAKH